MGRNQTDFVKFLDDVRRKHYDKEFASFHASNLIMQEGEINYHVDLSNSTIRLILDFFVKLDACPIDEKVFKRIVNDLIEVFNNNENQEESQILFTLYKEQITQLYKKYIDNKISMEALKSALRKYCNRKEGLNKLINLASAS